MSLRVIEVEKLRNTSGRENMKHERTELRIISEKRFLKSFFYGEIRVKKSLKYLLKVQQKVKSVKLLGKTFNGKDETKNFQISAKHKL